MTDQSGSPVLRDTGGGATGWADLETIVLAIDGPSGSGKSSTSRSVAQRLGLRYLDTGAMYRAMTWWMLSNGVDVTNAEAVGARVRAPELLMSADPAASSVSIDGEDVTSAVRSQQVTEAVSSVSAVPAVRARMVGEQRAIIGAGGIVVEGRDIGTVVAPDAAVKVYLVASAQARAQRRHAELRPPDVGAEAGFEAGSEAGAVAETGAALIRRDTLDSTRAASPLLCADDAVVIDSTHRTLGEVVELIVDLVTAAAGNR